MVHGAGAERPRALLRANDGWGARLLLVDRPNKYALRAFSAGDLRLLQVILD